jgi:DNA-binding MarR family transcriptional regulator
LQANFLSGGDLVTSDAEHDRAENLYALVHHVSRRLRAADNELGLSPTRFSVLGRLNFHGPCTIGELAAMENVRSPSMTRLVADMEADGFAVRFRPDSDRRKVEVRLTARGRRLVEKARARKIAFFKQALDEHGVDEQQMRWITAVLEHASGEPLWPEQERDGHRPAASLG